MGNTCRLSTCRRAFVPKRIDQEFCTPTCRKTFHREAAMLCRLAAKTLLDWRAGRANQEVLAQLVTKLEPYAPLEKSSS